jgi:hypothetical protein
LQEWSFSLTYGSYLARLILIQTARN